MTRQVVFLGSSQEDLQEWPDAARREAGHQLWRVQNDKEPTDWKPLPIIGPGTRGIRIQEDDGQWRVMYVAKIRGLVHVLHVFNKKTQQTSQRDIDLGKARYRSIRMPKGKERTYRSVWEAIEKDKVVALNLERRSNL